MALFFGRVDGDWIEATLESPPATVESLRDRRDARFLTGPFRDRLNG